MWNLNNSYLIQKSNWLNHWYAWYPQSCMSTSILDFSFISSFILLHFFSLSSSFVSVLQNNKSSLNSLKQNTYCITFYSTKEHSQAFEEGWFSGTVQPIDQPMFCAWGAILHVSLLIWFGKQLFMKVSSHTLNPFQYKYSYAEVFAKVSPNFW